MTHEGHFCVISITRKKRKDLWRMEHEIGVT